MATRIMGWLACAGAVALLIVAMVTGTAPASATPPGGEGQTAHVVAAWVQLSPVPGRPAAGYFTLTAAATPAELVTVTSPLARVELHGMSMAGGIMRMDRLPALRVGAGKTVRLSPGGAHLMLFDVAAGVRPGAMLPLTFTFADGSTRTADAAVRAAGGASPMAAMKM